MAPVKALAAGAGGAGAETGVARLASADAPGVAGLADGVGLQAEALTRAAHTAATKEWKRMV